MSKTPKMETVEIAGEVFYKIVDHDAMRPFFMSLVSDSNHWMFLSSNGGLTAGRKNADFALFPYYTDDKITELADITGSKSIFQIHTPQKTYLWEPFSDRFNDPYRYSRNLYKNNLGNSVIFEEIWHDLSLTFRYQWNTSHEFGFVKTSEIINHSDQEYDITFLDGFQNILPQGVSSDLQNSTSNLVDAYKRSELLPETGLGIFALSAIIVDKAEPSEALKANIVWSLGIENPTYLLSSTQLSAFRKQLPLHSESDIKGEKGAYFISSDFSLTAQASQKWYLVGNVHQSQSQVVALSEKLHRPQQIQAQLLADIELGKNNLRALNAGADGIQYTNDDRRDTRHFSNVLFNIMRGGIFDHHYQIEKADFLKYLSNANQMVYQQHSSFLAHLPDVLAYADLQKQASALNDADLFRLSTEYLPLKFSRRHGDPSRPWNKFSINTFDEKDGSKVLDYEGNWRDIFQNWESLAHAYPEFIDGMIHKFLNASTFDGYNPYRVTKSGFDWETIEPDNPWSYIGYWGDHQIIYLLKFLEFIEKHQPGKLHTYFDQACFVYAAVPYIIKPYQDILRNPKNTIEYNYAWDQKIKARKAAFGADGALLFGGDEQIYRVNLIEKVLATVLAKMSNFIPEGGIWMNTQRPEWNDANNALVGNGVSMVTLYYLHRFLKFFQNILTSAPIENCKISSELVDFYHAVRMHLLLHQPLLQSSISDQDRKIITDGLGQAASDYRHHIYQSGFWGKKRTISIDGLKVFTQVSLDFITHTIQANKRADALYHAYNLMSIAQDGIQIAHLPEMLEGQVAVLSSGYISAKEALGILDALRQSDLYRADQNSYILYPNKSLPKFLGKNTIPSGRVQDSVLLQALVKNKNTDIIEQDIKGNYHFNGDFHNADDLKKALQQLSAESSDYSLVIQETQLVLDIFEEVFNHKAFTGRSGTFFGYEGLGSIYWHMVSKLHLAVQEIVLKAADESHKSALFGSLLKHYQQIGEGIGLHKSPALYGAFPTDPYSHTPLHRGAQQPGMTGQVKEDILTRIGELGLTVQSGKLSFKPTMLRKSEFLTQDKTATWVMLDGTQKNQIIHRGQLAFTICQTPVVYELADATQLEVHFKDGSKQVVLSNELDAQLSQQIFQRTGRISNLKVSIDEAVLL
ncbi:MAG: hypothetical protein JST78_03390 [Bacteroidetes bacterium]|nr:hypothetical protein [Bacteroidota bacterium]